MGISEEIGFSHVPLCATDWVGVSSLGCGGESHDSSATTDGGADEAEGNSDIVLTCGGVIPEKVPPSIICPPTPLTSHLSLYVSLFYSS